MTLERLEWMLSTLDRISRRAVLLVGGMSRESGKTATNGKVGGIPAKAAITNSDYFSQQQLSKIRTSVTIDGEHR
ncbi:hypothetical protein OAF83_03590 [Rubripirellula sp.]|nr:hypothetical protein [Rubripirellula sp.]MDB4749967.1 hypothetical protein [Rubripirellula sp.]